MRATLSVRRCLLLTATVLIAGCNRSADASARPTVALVVKTLNNQFFIDMEAGARATADSLGLELIVQAPEREIDVERQMQIVASQPANMERDQAFNVTQNILQAHPDITALFACKDVMALGALEAIAAAGKGTAITVVGFDAQDDARKAIAEKRMAATIAQNPREMGRLAVLTAHRLLKGESVPTEQPVAISLVR